LGIANASQRKIAASPQNVANGITRSSNTFGVINRKSFTNGDGMIRTIW